MISERTVQVLEVSSEIHPLLKIADEAGCETDQTDSVGQAAVGDDVVLGQGGGMVGFIDGEFDLIVPPGQSLHRGDVTGQFDRVVDGPSVFDSGSQTGLLGAFDLRPGFQCQFSSAVFSQPCQFAFDLGEPLPQSSLVVTVGLLVDVIRGVDGEETVAGGSGDVGVVGRLEVIGVAAGGAGPAGLLHAVQRVVEHVPG